MNKPLTLEQAQNICLNYQFLEGTPFDREFGNTTPILAVLVAPYEEQAQQQFMDDYDLLGYTDLSAFSSAEGYDVIVVARYQPDEEICLWTDVRSFVKKHIRQVAKYHKAYIISDTTGGVAA